MERAYRKTVIGCMGLAYLRMLRKDAMVDAHSSVLHINITAVLESVVVLCAKDSAAQLIKIGMANSIKR